MSNRDTLRSKLLATKKPKTTEVDLFGEKIELRQPTLKQLMKMQTENNSQNAVVQILIAQSVVPGTDEPVFDKEDEESLMSWPVGEWLENLTNAINELSGTTTGEAKNS